MRDLLVDGLRPEAGAVLGRQLLELEPEDLGERRGGGRPDIVDGDRTPSSRAIVVKAASSSPQAVIQSVNGAGSRSTLSA